jgi:CheY-like chemotaxis protein
VRLYLCDDNDHYRQLARLVLERAGHEILGEATDGQQAIDDAPQHSPDVLLLDLNMPVVDGFTALPTLREALPETKIFILTTGQARDERERALHGGADGFIVKPDRIFALADELEAALTASGG